VCEKFAEIVDIMVCVRGMPMKRKRSTRLFDDTSPAAEEKLLELLRTKTPCEKLSMVNQLNASVRTLAMSGLRSRYPDAEEIELKRRFADLVLGAERASVVFDSLSKSRIDLDE
jgi:hypothetical protein